MQRLIAQSVAWCFALLVCASNLFGAEASPIAEKQDENVLRPSVSLRGGFIAFARHHNFYVESQWDYPLIARDRLFLSFAHRDTTPFLDTGGVLGTEFQVEQLHSTETLLLEYELTQSLAVKSVHRYEHTWAADRPGKVFGYEMGFGIGSPSRDRLDGRFLWEVAGGPVFNVQSLDANWFLTGRGSWRWLRVEPPAWAADADNWGVSLDANLESVNDGNRFHSQIEAGPTLRLPTKGGSQMDLFAHWIYNFDNPFGMARDGGLLVGLQMDSWGEPNWGHDALDFKAGRVFPSVWARYEMGAWDTHRVTVFETGIELLQIELARAPITAAVWYQHRQEFHDGDFDHTNYSVAVGPQTVFTVPLVSPLLARNEPVVVALEFMHRSDHGLDPPVERMTPHDTRNTPLGGYLQHSNANIWRLRFQSLGWNEPYRYKDSYEKQTRWLGIVDWNVTVGMSVGKWSRRRDDPRGQPASQIAANVDLASIEGVVLYSRGSYALKQETPNYLWEVGLKRPSFRVFARAEDYAVTPVVSKGGVFYLGFGVDL